MVSRFCPISAACLSTYKLPCTLVTSVAFGGKSLDQLYITTASCELSGDERREQPLAGSLFRIDFASTDIRGVPAGVYEDCM